MSKPLISIEPRGLRVEFEGRQGPTQLVVPLIFHPGKHRGVRVRVRPRPGVTLCNEVKVGDAFQSTFSRSRSTSAGGSFFATASHTRTFGRVDKTYEVVSLPDFQGVLFRLDNYDVNEEPIGVQLAFPISSYNPHTDTDYFAEVSLETDKIVIETLRVPREIHPKAGKVLLLSGYSKDFHVRMSAIEPLSRIAEIRLPFLQVSELKFFQLEQLHDLLNTGFQGIHLYTNVCSDKMFVNDEIVSTIEFFNRINGFGLKFIYIDTCNSVQVVSSFRRTDIGALVAATENLWEDYADRFESQFYHELGHGVFISQAFQRAASAFTEKEIDSRGYPTRSGLYDPMFLDMRVDFSFREKA